MVDVSCNHDPLHACVSCGDVSCRGCSKVWKESGLVPEVVGAHPVVNIVIFAASVAVVGYLGHMYGLWDLSFVKDFFLNHVIR